MNKPALTTRRLLLRPMDEDDLPALRAILQDPVAMKAYEHPFSEEEVRDWLARQRRRRAADGLGLLAVCLKSTGEMIGQCGVTWQDATGAAPFGQTPPPEHRVLEVGYLFRRDCWHQGYAAEAACACRDWAFRRRGAKAVYAIVRDTNTPSRRVALRMGMKPSGLLVKHYYGVEMPHILYSITREQWLRLKGQVPEVWDVYDKNRRRTGDTVHRGSHLGEGQYFMAVAVTVLTPDGHLLLTLRSPQKKQAPDTWEVSGGAALAGESAPEAACRELCEETGLLVFPRQLEYLGAEWRHSSFMEQFLLRTKVDLNALTLQPGETCAARLLGLEQALALAEGGRLEGRPLCAPVSRRLRAQAPLLRRAAAGQPLWPDGRAPALAPGEI